MMRNKDLIEILSKYNDNDEIAIKTSDNTYSISISISEKVLTINDEHGKGKLHCVCLY